MSKQFEIVRTGVSPVDTIIIRDAKTCEYVCEIQGYGPDVERCGLSKEAIEIRAKKMTDIANLLAAAPELLCALDEIQNKAQYYSAEDLELLHGKVDCIIAKAKGE